MMNVSLHDYSAFKASQNIDLQKKYSSLENEYISLKNEVELLRKEFIRLKEKNLLQDKIIETVPCDNNSFGQPKDDILWEKVSSKKKSVSDEPYMVSQQKTSVAKKTIIDPERESFFENYHQNVKTAYIKSETELLQILVEAYGDSDDTEVYRIGECGDISLDLITSLSCKSKKNQKYTPGYWKNKDGVVTDFAKIFNHLNPTFCLNLTGFGTKATIQKV